jgi:hypothetical protein
MKTYFNVNVLKHSEVDIFEDGCQPDTSMEFGTIEIFKVDTVDEILESVKNYGAEPYIFEDRLEVQRLENSDGSEATPHEIERWKIGKIKLWAVSYSFYISMVKEEQATNEKLILAFPHLNKES